MDSLLHDFKRTVYDLVYVRVDLRMAIFKSKSKRPCPACDRKRAYSIGTFPPNAPGKYSQNFDLLACACGSVFQSPLPTDLDFETLYQMNSQFDSPEYEDKEKIMNVIDFMTGRLEFIMREHNFPETLSILEVGAGYAWMCRSAVQILPLSFRVAQDVTNEVSDKTPWVNQYLVSDFKFDNGDFVGKFDLISLTHVLEHISNPKEYLSLLRNYLTTDGVIFITMPHRPIGNIKSIDSWNDWSYHHVPAHLQYFNRNSLNHLLTGTGLAISFWDETSENGQASELHLIKMS
jgi:SAM-dependent methyltransferase